MRILCLDVGTKRIGMAISDLFGWTAQPMEVLLRHSTEKDCVRIITLCREHEVQHIIIGIPLNEEGDVGPAAKKLLTFQGRLEEALAKANLDIRVEGWDERYSTAEAEERLLEANVSRTKRRKVIDKMAAVVILESYLRSKEL